MKMMRSRKLLCFSVLFVTFIGCHVAGFAAWAKEKGELQPLGSVISDKHPTRANDGNMIENIDFHRSMEGAGLVFIDFLKVPQEAEIVMDDDVVMIRFVDTGLSNTVAPRLEVIDFATPVSVIEIDENHNEVVVQVHTRLPVSILTSQEARRLRVEIRPGLSGTGEVQVRNESLYVGAPITLNFGSIPVREALQIIADFTDLNLVTSDAVEGELSLNLKEVPWDQALEVILQTRGLSMRRSGKIIWIAPTAEMVAKERQALELTNSKAELEPLTSELIGISYAKAEDMAAMLKSVKAVQTGIEQSIFGATSVSETKTEKNSLLSSRGSVTVDSRTNSLLIQDTATKLDELKRLISRLDIPVRQVQIETRIITAYEDFSRNIGARLGFTRVPGSAVQNTNNGISGSGKIENANPYTNDSALSVNLPASAIGGEAAGSYAFTLAKLGSGFLSLLDLEISALQAEGNGRVLANPKIMTTDKRKASIEQGQERLTTFGTAFGTSSSQGQKAMLSLTVLPQITPDNHIILDVDITNDAFVSANTDTVNTRRINTQTLLDDGETVVIGGIYTEEAFNRITKVPVLGDIPYLGALFRKKVKRNNRSELLIFLTPRIIDSALEVQ
ncbi:MAG: type IV pilus secretin PilQ [Gammaproteobacteria bacterium]|nr:type IV pilus secretin PilQ [Gammaproteobacteria bacterium]